MTPFSREKQRAIRQLNYSASTKILFQVRERIWETDDGIFGGATVTDLPIRRMNYPTPDPTTLARRAPRELHVGPGRGSLGRDGRGDAARGGARGRREDPPSDPRGVRGRRLARLVRRPLRERRVRAVRGRASRRSSRRTSSGPRAGSTSRASTARCTTPGSRARSSPGSGRRGRSTRRRRRPRGRLTGDVRTCTRSPAAALFRHGVASGDPTSRRVVIWTRVSGAVRDDAGPGALADPRGPTRAARPATASRSPGPRPTGRSASTSAGCGRTRATRTTSRSTASDRRRARRGRCPRATPRSIRFGQVSCAKYNAGHFNAYARLAERDDLALRPPPRRLDLRGVADAAGEPDARARTSGGRSTRSTSAGRSTTTARRYAQYRRDPDVQAVSAAHPIIATVDDHEFADGAWRDGATEHKPERDGPWAARRAAAFRAREEWLPVRRPDPARPGAGLPRRCRSGRSPSCSCSTPGRGATSRSRRRRCPGRTGRRSGRSRRRGSSTRLGALDGALAAARQPVGDVADLERRAARVRPPARS